MMMASTNDEDVGEKKDICSTVYFNIVFNISIILLMWTSVSCVK